MKTLLTAFTMLVFTSCKKESHYTAPADIKGEIQFDVLLNGSNSHFSYQETIGYTFRRVPGPTDTTGMFFIYLSKPDDASGNNYKEISFAIDSLVTTGSYSFGPNSTAGHAGFSYRLKKLAAGMETDYNSSQDIPNGHITIDSLAHDYIRGSFEVTCWNGNNSAVLNNGSFKGKIYYN